MRVLEKSLKMIRHKVQPWLPSLFLVLMLLPFHMLVPFFGDDTYYQTQNLDANFLLMRYTFWSSRLLIDFVVMLFVRCFWLWKIINVCIIVLLNYMLQKIFVKSTNGKWLVAALVLLYPIFHMSTAGWIATTVNYAWPLAFGLVGIYPAIKVYREERIRFFEYPIYIISLLYGANQELMVVVILAIYAVMIIVLLRKDGLTKKLAFPTAQFLLSVASIVFIITTPGNMARYQSEIATFFLDYEMLSIPRKLSLGFSRTLSHLFFSRNMLFLVLCIGVCLLVWLRRKEWLARVIALVPLIVCLLFGFNAAGERGLFLGKLVSVANRHHGLLDVANYYDKKAFVCFFILGISTICLGISLFIAFEKPSNSWIAIGILALGLGTSMMMAFSPTVWASGDRTYIFLYYALICVTLLMYREYRRAGYQLRTAVGLTVVASFTLFLFNVWALLN